MPYEPTFPHPYLEAIDVTLEGGNNFQCVINPRDKITAYEITISSVKDGNEVCHVGAKEINNKLTKYYSIASGANIEMSEIPISDSPLPFQGKANSDDSIFVVNIPSVLVTEDGLQNGNEYFWTITLTKDDVSTTSKEFYFTSVSMPKIEFNVPSMVNSNRINISATYSQAENLLPAFYKVILYNRAKEVYVTDDIFSSDIVFEYDKLMNNEDYEIELSVVLDNGMEITNSYFFSVSYNEAHPSLFSTVEVNNQDTYVSIDCSQQASINGFFGGGGNIMFAKAKNQGEDTPEKPNILTLNDSQNVFWNKSGNNPIDFENTSQVIHWHAHDGFKGMILKKVDEFDMRRNISVSFEDGAFLYIEGQNDPQYHYLYKSDASAIAGDDEYSVAGTVLGYNQTEMIVTVESHSFITEGLQIQIGEEYRTITKVSKINEERTDVYLDNTFTISPIILFDKYAIYSKDYHYVLSDSTVIKDTDILLWNDFTPKSWYFICLTPSGVKYIEDPNEIEIIYD